MYASLCNSFWHCFDSRQTIRIWNIKTGECLRTLRDHDHVIESIEFSNSAAAETYIKALVCCLLLTSSRSFVVTVIVCFSAAQQQFVCQR